MDHHIRRVLTSEMRTIAEKFTNAHHSYIKWSDRPSRKMYWLLYENSNVVGVFGLSSAFARPKIIQEFMEKNSIEFNELANNIVYCLDGCQDKNAGTKFLKLVRQDAAVWWNDRYGDTLKAFQTFILPPRLGVVFKADNWVQLGQTTGKCQTVRTIKAKDTALYPKAERRIFKSGRVRYLVREFSETEPKLIFVRLTGSIKAKKTSIESLME